MDVDVLNAVRVGLARGASVAQVERLAPALRRAGLLKALRAGSVARLELGTAAAEHDVDIFDLQRAVFDLIRLNKLRLADEAGTWDTRVLVEDSVLRHRSNFTEDEAHRAGRQAAGSKRVDALGAYAKSRRCRRWHFYRAFGYQELYEGGCGKCDVCER
jgi:hypothetical protein